MSDLHQFRLDDATIDAATALRYEDCSRVEHEKYLSRVEHALANLDGRRRKDAGAKWARPQLQAEALLVRKILDRADACADELEMTRAAYRAACDRFAQTQASVEAASDVDALLRAQAQLTLDLRAAHAARVAFGAAAAKAKLPGEYQAYPLRRGFQLASGSTANQDVVRHAPGLAEHDPTGRNGDTAAVAARVIGAARETEPVAMVWIVAGETGYRTDEQVCDAFDQRFASFARRWAIEQPAARATAAE